MARRDEFADDDPFRREWKPFDDSEKLPRLLQNPRAENLQRYEAWLLKKGDVRGELGRVMRYNERAGVKFADEHADLLFGAFAGEFTSESLEVTWDGAFVVGAKLGYEPGDGARSLRAFLQLPITCLLRSLGQQDMAAELERSTESVLARLEAARCAASLAKLTVIGIGAYDEESVVPPREFLPKDFPGLPKLKSISVQLVDQDW